MCLPLQSGLNDWNKNKTPFPKARLDILSGSLNLKGKISLLNNVNISKGVKLNMMPIS